MQEYIEKRNRAKELLKKEKYEEALPLYENIYAPDCDKWIAWEYARLLKQLLRLDDSIGISKSLYQREKTFTYNNNLLSWLLYEKYFKEKKSEYTVNEISKLYNIAIYVATFTKQEKTSAYEKIIIQMLKILKLSNNIPYTKVLSLLERLDVTLLSAEAGKFEKDGRTKEYQSPKEMYYSLKTKALIETEEFELCIECCNKALEDIGVFHHDNNTWILSRKALSYAGLADFECAIKLQKEVLLKKPHWSLLGEFAEMHLKLGDSKTALLYYCRAALTNDPPKMKVGLYIDIAKVLQETGDTKGALHHLLFSRQVREQESWSVPFAISNAINELSSQEKVIEIKLHDLKLFWQKVIYDGMGLQHGNISRLNAGGKTGFIQSGNHSYFFKSSSFIGKPLFKVGTNVVFVLIDSFDIKKNQPSCECGYIKID